MFLLLSSFITEPFVSFKLQLWLVKFTQQKIYVVELNVNGAAIFSPKYPQKCDSSAFVFKEPFSW